VAASDTPADAGRDDAFPTGEFTRLLGRLPRYGRLAFRLGRDQRLPSARRAALIAGAVYLFSPIDLVPGFIPVAGQLDDAAAVLLALRIALRGLPAADRTQAFADVGLAEADLERDLGTIGSVYAWLGRQAARISWRVAMTGARLGREVGRFIQARLQER